MRAEEIQGLMEAYSKVHETPEVVEEVVEETKQLDEAGMDLFSAVKPSTPSSVFNRSQPQPRRGMDAAIDRGLAKAKSEADAAAARKFFGLKDKPKPAARPTQKPSNNSAAAKPTASGVVLAKKGGVEGKLDKATGKFTAGAFTDKEKARYTQRAPKTNTPSATTTPAKPTPSTTPAAKPSSYNPLMQKTFGYQTGAAPDQVKGSAAFNKPEIKTPQPAKPLSTTAGFGAVKPLKQDVDIFDLVKGHLLDEGYAETEQNAIVIMANMSEEWRESIIEEIQQLDEISLKTKMKAYAASRDVDADYAYGSKVHDQGDRIKANIVKKHGKEAGEHAERHADVSNFGRKDASGKYKGLPKSRIEKSDYRTTASGKMHKQDQSELKRELRIRRGKKLRAADADDDN